MQLYLSENKSKNIFKDAVDYYIHPQNTKKSFCLLICSLRNDFEGARKVDLQSRIFFRLEKSGSAKLDFFLVGEKRYCKIGFFFLLETRKKIQLCRTTFLPPSKSLLRVQIKSLFECGQKSN